MTFSGISTPRAAAVVLGAGSGTRVGHAQNKVFLPLAGRRVLSWSFNALAKVAAIERFVMVIREGDRAMAEAMIVREIDGVQVEVVVGGASRHDSELAALRHLAPAIAAGEINIVLIHDGARPILSPRLVRTLIGVAAEHGAVIPGIAHDDIRFTRPDGSIDLRAATQMVAAQTPQVFDAATLLGAYEQAEADGFIGTDTASCVDQYSDLVLQWVPGEARNIKITYSQDLFIAEDTLRDSHYVID